MTANKPLANAPRQPQHEHQHFGHGFIELGWNLVADFDLGERAGEDFVLLDRNIVGSRDLDDLGAERAAALGDDARRAGLVIVKRNRKLAPGLDAHSARSRKWPARGGAGCDGAPSRITISPGCSSALASADVSCAAPARNCAAVAGRSAHIRTDVRSPLSTISA